MSETTSPTELLERQLADLAIACYEAIIRLAKRYPSQSRQLLEDPRDLADMWAAAMQRENVPASLVPELVIAAEARLRSEGQTTYPPTHQDILLAWETRWKAAAAATASNHWTDKGLKPVVLSEVAPPASRNFLVRRAAVVCECRYRDGMEMAAKLSADGTHWVCGQSGSAGACNFYLMADQTAEAPLPEFSYTGATRKRPEPVNEPEAVLATADYEPDEFDE